MSDCERRGAVLRALEWGEFAGRDELVEHAVDCRACSALIIEQIMPAEVAVSDVQIALFASELASADEAERIRGVASRSPVVAARIARARAVIAEVGLDAPIAGTRPTPRASRRRTLGVLAAAAILLIGLWLGHALSRGENAGLLPDDDILLKGGALDVRLAFPDRGVTCRPTAVSGPCPMRSGEAFEALYDLRSEAPFAGVIVIDLAGGGRVLVLTDGGDDIARFDPDACRTDCALVAGRALDLPVGRHRLWWLVAARSSVVDPAGLPPVLDFEWLQAHPAILGFVFDLRVEAAP